MYRERDVDIAGIRRLLERAFLTDAEAWLVGVLRAFAAFE